MCHGLGGDSILNFVYLKVSFFMKSNFHTAKKSRNSTTWATLFIFVLEFLTLFPFLHISIVFVYCNWKVRGGRGGRGGT